MPNNHSSFLKALFGEGESARKKVRKSIKAKADAKRTFSERLADSMTEIFGSMGFLLINAVVFLVWILINTGTISFVPQFDPYPFNLLTTAVSLEAIFLAVFVLISQNRTMRVDDLREETSLQVNLIEERETTKVMKMLAILLERQGVDLSQDPELKALIKPISEEEIEKSLEKEIF